MKYKRYAVIGVGRMGSNHIRVLSEMAEVDLIAICDTDEQAARNLSGKQHIDAYYADVRDMLEKEKLDAVVVAAPTTEHLSIAEECIRRGIDLFIEKPMASTVEQCQRIIDLATENETKIFIGHIERYNPVVSMLKKFVEKKEIGEIYYIETIRSGPFPKRLYGSKDGVVIDLAVHDLDLVNFLLDPIVQIFAHHIQTQTHSQDIYAKVMFRTGSKILGSSEFSWISPKKERRISIYGDRGLLQGNLVDQEVWYFENGDVGVDYSDNYYQNVLWGKVSEGKVIKYPIKREEPLRREHDYFYRMVNGKINDYDPLHGKLAVQYSLSVLKSASENTIVNIE